MLDKIENKQIKGKNSILTRRGLSIFLILFLIPMILIFSCTSKTKNLFTAYIAYYNKHDLNSRMALYADTAKFELVNGWLKTGKKSIGEYEAFMDAVESTISVSEVETKGDIIYCLLTEKDNLYNLLGINKLEYRTRFTFRGGLITEIIYSLTPESGLLLRTASKPFTQWVSENHRADWDELINKTGFIYNKDTAGKWLDLARRWQKEKNQDK
jgi:hypothetical protein